MKLVEKKNKTSHIGIRVDEKFLQDLKKHNIPISEVCRKALEEQLEIRKKNDSRKKVSLKFT